MFSVNSLNTAAILVGWRTTTATSCEFFAAERIIAGPPISICSIASSRVTFAADRFRKRIEIHDDHIDRFDSVLLHGGDVFRVVTNREQAAMNAWMQCLDAAIHHLGKASDVGDVANVMPASRKAFAVPPVLMISTLKLA